MTSWMSAVNERWNICRYTSIAGLVTGSGLCSTVTVCWVLSIVFTLMYFLNREIILWYSKIGLSLCLVFSVFPYVKIFFVLRHNQIQVQNHVHQEQPSQTAALNIARYRKSVSRALWVQLALVVCYLPYWYTASFE